VHGQPDEIGHVLVNLMDNALRAMPAGGTLSLAVRRAGDSVEATVTDSGPGVPPDLLAHVFEPFFTRRSDGTGLGLAVADRIARSHGGRLAVHSPPGHGAAFTLSLPALDLGAATGGVA
jgi:signal transduction histidine kinase